MKILDAGHKYLLGCLDGDEEQILTFVKRCGEGFPFNHGHYPGTNCQEVLRALIDRCEYLNRQIPCGETEAIIGCLKTALLLFEIRAGRRHGRQIDTHSLLELVSATTCKTCGHVQCQKHNSSDQEAFARLDKKK